MSAVTAQKEAEYRELIAQHKEAAPGARAKVYNEGFRVSFEVVADDAAIPEGSVKKVHFIRHGEGFHNVAQKEWRADPSWDGHSEPYTTDNDPEGRYIDPCLTPKGESEAKQLQPRCAAAPTPEILVVSPMRRAMQTGLCAYEAMIKSGELKVVANELAHERSGVKRKHTCDQRSDTPILIAEFPEVDFSEVESEKDPLWNGGDGCESIDALAERACRFIAYLSRRPEHVAVAAHSQLLLSSINAAMDGEEEASKWFVTGEMRTLLIRFDQD